MSQKSRRRFAVWPPYLSSLVIVLAVAGCAPDIQTISAQDLAEYLAEGKTGRVFHLVDLQPVEVFEAQHLPGARSVPYDRLAADQDLFLDGKPVIFYDDDRPDIGKIRKALGSRLPANIVALAGGNRAWIAAGLAVEPGKS